MTSVRRSQLIAPFGVGAVVDIGPEAFTCIDTSRWRADEVIDLPASILSQRLHRQICAPIGSVPYYRFPRWHFCPRCRRMHRIDDRWDAAHSEKYPGRPPRCPKCSAIDLTPIGFVQACEDGHLEDIDWHRWAHHENQRAKTGSCAPASAELSFLTSGANGGDWNTLSITCSCGASRTLEGLTTAPLPWSCSGRQPWQQVRSKCSQRPAGVRRGSSNLYYPSTLSAIDVEGTSGGVAGGAAVRNAVRASIVNGAWSIPMVMIELTHKQLGIERVLKVLERHLAELAHQLAVPTHEVSEALAAILSAEDPGRGEPTSELDMPRQTDFLRAEWMAFARDTALRTEKLIVEPRPMPRDWALEPLALVRRVAAVSRLREVRALTGFRRIKDQGSTETPVDLSGGVTWLPGVEVWGEGIFIEFDQTVLADWEARSSARFEGRIRELEELATRWRDPEVASARFIAIHTLSHLIMRRLAFDAGYSSSSLRERVYSSRGAEPMAGLLIYTADADSEGSLGGLVRMAEPTRLGPVLRGALNDGAWCSADPVCGETARQGTSGTNGAACHACALVPETCCTHGNQLLDRRMLLDIGTPNMEHGLVSLRTSSPRVREDRG